MEHKNLEGESGEHSAASFDQQREKLAPIKDALHLNMRMILSNLPPEANILCVGAGTGAELIYLAQEFPQWHFTAVDPAEAMLNICRKRVASLGLQSRCTFHQGHLDTLSSSIKYDAATSILVSHYIEAGQQRIAYFAEIASRLKASGILVNADLSCGMSTSNFKKMLPVWVAMHEYSGMPVKIEAFERSVASTAIEQVESVLQSSGFESPVLFCQSLFIHAWFSVKSN